MSENWQDVTIGGFTLRGTQMKGSVTWGVENERGGVSFGRCRDLDKSFEHCAAAIVLHRERQGVVTDHPYTHTCGCCGAVWTSDNAIYQHPVICNECYDRQGVGRMSKEDEFDFYLACLRKVHNAEDVGYSCRFFFQNRVLQVPWLAMHPQEVARYFYAQVHGWKFDPPEFVLEFLNRIPTQERPTP